MIFKQKLGRQNPTADKVRLLAHLWDCCDAAQGGVQHGLEVLRTLVRWVDEKQRTHMLWDGGESICSRFAKLHVDVEFFDTYFSQAKADTGSLQTMMRDHLSLNQERRSFVLTVLATIFLPLSFTASLLGMNMTSPTHEGPVDVSKWVNFTIDGLPSDLRNQTETLISTISTSGTLTWTWTRFTIIAVCLTITLPLSLTLENLARIIVHSARLFPTYWRALTIPPSIAFIFMSTLAKYVGLLGEWYPIPTSWGVKSSLILFEVGKVYLAWQNKSHRTFWTSILVLSAICFGLDVLGFFVIEPVLYFPWMLLPWVWFALRWIQSIRTSRRQQRQKTRSQNPVGRT